MNTKVLVGFLAGVLAASGVGYYMSHRQTQAAEPNAVQASTSAPAAGIVTVPAESQKELPQPAAPRQETPAVPQIRRKPARVAARIEPPAGTPVQSAPAVNAEPERQASLPPALPPAAPQVQEAAAVPAPTSERVSSPATPAVALPPAPEPRHSVTLSSGTLIAVRLGETLSTERHRSGDTFVGTIDQPVVADGFVIAERGARVEGRVVESQPAGRVKGLAELSVQLTKLHTSDGQTVDIRTAAFLKNGPESKGEDAAKVGIGAVLGTIIGAAAGGGKGAAIGAAAGGAAGAGTVAATRGKPAELPVETRISFRLDQPVTITEQLRR